MENFKLETFVQLLEYYGFPFPFPFPLTPFQMVAINSSDLSNISLYSIAGSSKIMMKNYPMISVFLPVHSFLMIFL